MSDRDRSGGGSLLLAFLVGAAAGAAIAWLATRRPGERGRAAADFLRGSADAATRAGRAARDAFAKAAEAAKASVEESLRDGAARRKDG